MSGRGTVIETHNAFHLGDQVLHLLFLRRLSEQNPAVHFKHAAPRRFLDQLFPLIQGARIGLVALEGSGPIGHNAWRGADGFWYAHPHRHDFVRANIDWFERLAHQMGFLNPIQSPDDFLWDFSHVATSASEWPSPVRPELQRILFINSEPHSGQFAGFDRSALELLARALWYQGHSVFTTQWIQGPKQTHPRDVAQIGHLARDATMIIGVATGPLWTTYTTQNRHATRLLLLDHERVHIAPNTHHFTSIPALRAHCHALGLL